MSLKEIIEETNEELLEARNELEVLLLAIEGQRETIANLEDELHGLRLAAGRRGVSDEESTPSADVIPLTPDVAVPSSSSVDLGAMSRSDAVAYVLSLSDRPQDRHAIQIRMETLGRAGDTLDQISLALTNLKRCDRATKVGGGRWRISG